MAAVPAPRPRAFSRKLLRILAVLFLCWLAYGIICWSVCSCRGLHTAHFEHSKASMIASYTCDQAHAPVLTLERFVVENGYAYPFIFDHYYTDGFFLSDGTMSKEEVERWTSGQTYISERGDTLVERGGRTPVAYVPLTITARTRTGDLVATYRVDSVYEGNIDEKPSVPFFKLFRPLGWGEDCRSYCD